MHTYQLHYLLKMQMPGPAKIQVQWDWVAKAINLHFIKRFPEESPYSVLGGCSVHWLSHSVLLTVPLEVHKCARPTLVLTVILAAVPST